MDLAWISLAALLIVILVSCTTSVNPGFLSIVLAWLIGLYAAAWFNSPFDLKSVIAGFPSELFLTLVGVTLLFTQAEQNGTLEQVARFAVLGCRGNAGLIPVAFFFFAAIFSSIGAGNIAASALVSPLAMAAAARARIPVFPMTLMVTHGSIAGAVSPFSPGGIVTNKLMADKMGLPGWEWHTYGANLLANFVVAFVGFLLFGGWKLFNRGNHDDESTQLTAGTVSNPPFAFVKHGITLAVIAVLIVEVVFGKVHVGMAAFAGAVLLTLVRAADERRAVQGIPWSVLLMVCGVTVLTSLLEKTGGMERFAKLVSQTANPQTIYPIIAFVTGIISVYSSTTGVVLPAFLPMVPKLVTELGGGDPLAIALSIIVGGNLVDSSPLSTVGALCIASAPATEDRRRLFNRLLAWGLSMSVVGALFCYVAFGLSR